MLSFARRTRSGEGLLDRTLIYATDIDPHSLAEAEAGVGLGAKETIRYSSKKAAFVEVSPGERVYQKQEAA